jgi:hypothetical protein
MLSVVETPVFRRQAEAVWLDDERHLFIDWIASFPDAGAVIQGPAGLRKVRWGRRRGGVRAIYWVRVSEGRIVLLSVYAKASNEAFSATFLRELAKRMG